MLILSEAQVKTIATPELAFDAVSDAFIAAYQQRGTINPVVIAKGCDEGNTFSIKSGNMLDKRLSGLKVDPTGPATRPGIPAHGTTTLLLDEETGNAKALINAGYLNGLRTAAANAVATHALAREDAILGVLGAGHQAIYEIKALCLIRDIKRILISSRSNERVNWALAELAKAGIEAEAFNAEEVCRNADILTTVTNARAPLCDAQWIKPGTHISAMGADQAGKHELPIELINNSALFADLPSSPEPSANLK